MGASCLLPRGNCLDCIVNDKNPETSMKKLIRQPLQKYGAIELQLPNDIGLEKSGPSLDSYGMLELTIYCSSILIGRENEVQEAWPFVHWFLKGYGISSTLNTTERCLTISTTRRTMYPDIIDQAENFLELLARTSIPATKAAEILNGRLQYEVIKIGFQAGGLCAKYETDEEHGKNRERLKRNSKAVAGLLKCDIYINGCSAVAVGTSASGQRLFRSIVECCFLKNEDPLAVARRLKLDHKLCRLIMCPYYSISL